MSKHSVRQALTRGLLPFLALLIAFGSAVPRPALAAQPPTQTYFVCPAVSTNNQQGHWVIGTHGGYYVLVPTQGSTGSKVYLTIPVQVASLAQIPAGWALYNSLPNYPNFEGTAMLLAEGISTWLGSPAGWSEGDMASVVNNGNGTYTVTNLSHNLALTISHPIPLASAAVW